MTIRFDAKAKSLAQQTGLDKLGQAKLAKLDKNGDGVVTLTDVRRLTKDAALDKDQSLSRADRQRIDQALGGAPASSTTTTTGASSLVSTLAGGKKKLADVYISTEVKRTAQGLSISIDGTLYKGSTPDGKKATTQVLKAFDPAAVDVLFYSTSGKTGLPNSSGGPEGGFVGSAMAGGMAVAVADKARGLVLVDVAAKDFLDGAQPSHKKLLSLTDITKSAAVRSAAKKAGLDTKDLAVQLKEVWLSGAFEDSKINTIGFEAKITDHKGKSKTERFSTYLTGDLSKSVDKVAVEKLEVGMASSWGYLLPPSAKKAQEPAAPSPGNGGGGGYVSGGDLHVHSHNHVHHHVGGGEGVYVPTYGGGGGE